MLDIQNCFLVIVDVQGKLAQLMYDRDALFKNIRILIKVAKLLAIPIVWTQQCPQALGPTVPEVTQLLTDSEPINKASFSCCGEEQFNRKLKSLARRQVLLCGIEAHVCIYQTAADLMQTGYDVHIIADAISSRSLKNRQIGLEKMASNGAELSSTEMVIFELLKTAEHPQFKQIVKLAK